MRKRLVPGHDEWVDEMNNEAVRLAWNLTKPELSGSEPRWFRKAAIEAGKAGRLPKFKGFPSVRHQLVAAGYDYTFFDHPGVVEEDGERHMIFEPYESTCSMHEARRIARELAEKLQCRASVSMISWHNPGHTFRITFSPLPSHMVEDGHDATS